MGALPRPRMRLHKPGSPFAPPFRAVGLIFEPAIHQMLLGALGKQRSRRRQQSRAPKKHPRGMPSWYQVQLVARTCSAKGSSSQVFFTDLCHARALCTGAEEGACKGPRAKDVHFACPKPGLPNHSELLFLAFMVVDTERPLGELGHWAKGVLCAQGGRGGENAASRCEDEWPPARTSKLLERLRAVYDSSWNGERMDLIGIAMRSWSGLGCVLLCSP